MIKNLDWEKNLKQQIPNLRRYARALTRDVSSADDLVQDCLERAWDKRDTWTQGSNLRAWLFTIMHNLFVNGVRRQKIHQEYLDQTPIPSNMTNNDNSHLVRDLEVCLGKLKPDFREVILLAGLENLSYKEIAIITNVPIGTVMSRLSRGREELRHLMSEPSTPKLVRVK